MRKLWQESGTEAVLEFLTETEVGAGGRQEQREHPRRWLVRARCQKEGRGAQGLLRTLVASKVCTGSCTGSPFLSSLSFFLWSILPVHALLPILSFVQAERSKGGRRMGCPGLTLCNWGQDI